MAELTKVVDHLAQKTNVPREHVAQVLKELGLDVAAQPGSRVEPHNVDVNKLKVAVRAAAVTIIA